MSLRLRGGSMEITVTFEIDDLGDGNNFTLEVEPSDTTEVVKAEI